MALDKVPGKAWVVVFCGTAVNLCLGILYAWSVWTKQLISVEKAGQLITDGPWGRLDLSDQCPGRQSVFPLRPYLRPLDDSGRPYSG